MKSNGWTKYTIGELGKVVGGATPSTKNKDFWDGDISWITPKDLSLHKGRYISKGSRNITDKGFNSCSVHILPKGSVLFSSRAPIGYVAIAENDVCTNQGFKSVIPNSKIDPMFLYYLLYYNKEKIEKYGSGTTFKEVSGSTMKSIEVEIPCLDEQRRISDILDSIDNKIENNYLLLENLEDQNNTIFSYYFGTFEFYKNEEFVSIDGISFPKRFKLVKLKDILKTNKRGLTPKYNDSGIPIINQRCLRDGVLIKDSIQYHNPQSKFDKSTLYHPYDVLVNSMGVGTLGRISQVGCISDVMLIHNCISILRANEKYSQYLLGCLLKSMQRRIEEMGNGSTGQTSLSNKELGEIKVILPPIEEQKRIDEKIKINLDFISNILKEIELLKKIKIETMNHLFSDR